MGKLIHTVYNKDKQKLEKVIDRSEVHDSVEVMYKIGAVEPNMVVNKILKSANLAGCWSRTVLASKIGEEELGQYEILLEFSKLEEVIKVKKGYKFYAEI